MRRNAELEAKSGKAAKNATMILNSTTTMYKENSFLDNFRATSGPETIDSSAVMESADNAAIKHIHHHSHHIARLRQCRQRYKKQKRSSKNIESALQQRKNSTTPSHSSLNSTPSRKGAVPKVTVAAKSKWYLVGFYSTEQCHDRSNLPLPKARIVVLEEECLRAKEAISRRKRKKSCNIESVDNESGKEQLERKYNTVILYEKQKRRTKSNY